MEKLKSAESATITPINNTTTNPWTPDEVDTLDKSIDFKNRYHKTINMCRFFYRRDPLSSTTINKLVEIGVTDLTISKKGLSDNEYRVFDYIKSGLKNFARQMALEYLLTGLVVPEIKYGVMTAEELKRYSIKKYTAMTVPQMMWVRDPDTVIINSSMFGPEPSYFVKVPDDLVYFITHNGTYKDGTKDKKMYDELLTYYPEFVAEVMANKSGEVKILLDNPLIFRRKEQSYDQYPIPYLEPALEAVQHKRNLRRMDYSLASRVISAILLFKLGNDTYPVTEEDSAVFSDLKNQIMWRDNQGKNVERIFQLFANHTLSVEWIMPDISALVDDTKYKDINQEIIFALGFPRVLITGESEKTGTSDPEFSMKAPITTMESFRDEIIVVLQTIVNEVARQNKFTTSPTITFEPINLLAFKDFYTAINDLYVTGNISRTDYADMFGINWLDQMDKKEDENKVLKEKELGEFAPQAFSPAPGQPGANPQNNQNNNKNIPSKPTTNQVKPQKTQK